jgi:hypothetical protein
VLGRRDLRYRPGGLSISAILFENVSKRKAGRRSGERRKKKKSKKNVGTHI